jgi:hypothetical protein
VLCFSKSISSLSGFDFISQVLRLCVQGNEYFKEGKYVRAIDCYSRSIALQPTAVAYANRAMAAIKIRR